MHKQNDNEAAYRQLLVQGVLAILLPTEDLENDCLTAIVGQIFSEMIVGGAIGGKASEPWLLWEVITKVAEVIQEKLHSRSSAPVGREAPPSDDIDHNASLDTSGRSSKGSSIGQSIQRSFCLFLQYVFLAFTAARVLVITVASSTHLPSRTAQTVKFTGSVPLEGEAEPPKFSNSRVPPTKQPILKMKIWSCAAAILDLTVRMPWLSASLSMLQWAAVTGPGEIGNTDGIIDK